MMRMWQIMNLRASAARQHHKSKPPLHALGRNPLITKATWPTSRDFPRTLLAVI